MNRAVIIGGGIGGLATALRLAHAGIRVTLLEKNTKVGGKLNRWEDAGYRFDTGPSLITMPFVLRELFSSVGRTLEDHVQLIPVEPLCRYQFADGSTIDASADPGRMTDAIAQFNISDARSYRPFLDHCKRIYEAAAGPFLFSDIHPHSAADIVRMVGHLPALRHIDAFRPLHGLVASYFQDKRIRQLFDRFATYNGSSPYRAPATLGIIPYVEFGMGGWYIRGGLYRLAEVLEELVRESGVDLRTGSEVERMCVDGRRVSGVFCSDGTFYGADMVICNADPLYAERRLFPGNGAAPVRDCDVSLSGFVLFLGLKRRYDRLAHHNVLFSDDYPAEFTAMVDRGMPADDPTLYVAISSVTDPDQAPRGCSNMFVLVNAPPVGRAFSWAEHAATYREKVLDLLERRGLDGLRASIVTEQTMTPSDLESRYNAFRGTIYGQSSNSRFAAFRRPPMRSRRYPNLFYVGGGTHPGGGVPLVILSSAVVTRIIEHAGYAA